jgi:CO/xanthine dehydrogenase FAD-binding subunit
LAALDAQVRIRGPKDVEQAIAGRKLAADTVQKAVEAVVRKAPPMEQNGYKIPLFLAVVEEELTALVSA